MDRQNFILVSNKRFFFLHKLYNYTSKKATLLVFLDFQKKKKKKNKNYINIKNNNVSSYFLDFQKKKKDIVFYSYIFLL